MSEEMRKEHRRHIIYYLQIVNPETNTPIGRLVDLTTIGLMMVCENEYPLGQVVDLKIELPNDEFDQNEILVQGVGVWCHKDVNPDYYGVGIQFTKVTPETELIIPKLIQRLGFRD